MDLNHPANYITSATFGVFGVIGLFGNAFLFGFLIKGFKHRKIHETIIFGICIIDFLFCLSSVAESYLIFHGESLACRILGFVGYILATLNIVFPAVNVVNRYLWLHNQQLLKKWFTKTKLAIFFFVEICITVALLSPFYLLNAVGLDDLGVCGLKTDNLFRRLLFFTQFIETIITYTTCVFCGYFTIKKLKQHKAGLETNLKSAVIAESRQIALLMSFILAIPLFTQIPSLAAKYVQYFLTIDPWISRSAASLFPLSSTCNQYLTLYTIKDYRKKVRQIFKKQVVRLAQHS